MQILRECQYCGEKFELSELTELSDKKLYCSDCVAGFDECAECGETIPPDDETAAEVAGEGQVCGSCLKHWFVQCDDCFRWVRKGELTGTSDGGNVCDSCLESDYFFCENCEEYHENSEANTVQVDEYGNRREEWCDDCVSDHAVHCTDCNELLSRRDAVYLSDDDTNLCGRCAQDYYVCEDCDCVVHYDCAEHIDDCTYCESCAAKHRKSEKVKRYDYKMDICFLGEESDDPVLGVELEIDNFDDTTSAGDAIDDLDGIEEFFCMKEDGSLNNGFEVVSQPATLAYHRQEFPWAEIMDVAKRYGGRSHDAGTCGLHVHINRSALSEAGWKNMCWVYSQLIEQFEAVARRSRTRWACNLPDYGGPDGPAVALHSRDRYCWLNFTNDDTVEVRGFRGTLKLSTFFACLELVQATVDYCKVNTFGMYNLPTWADFFAFCSCNSAKYSDLLTYYNK